MRRHVPAFAIAAALVACVSSSDPAPSGTANGGACFDGSACTSGFCVVRGPSPQGTCEARPDACSSCAKACTDVLAGACAKPSNACTSSAAVGRTSGSSVTVGCSLVPSATEGQPCSFVVGCAKGLFCHVADRTTAGTCERLPDACGGAASCACLEPISSTCVGGTACQVVGDLALVQCG